MKDFEDFRHAAQTESGLALDAIGERTEIGIRRRKGESDYAYRIRMISGVEIHMMGLRNWREAITGMGSDAAAPEQAEER